MAWLNSARLGLMGAAILAVTVGVALGALLAQAVGLPFASQPEYSEAAKQLAESDRSRMQLESQYPGPLQDTTIQRWRDPVDGTVCYIYLPIAVAHSPGPNGLVQYGAAHIGTISCFPQAH